MQDTALILDPRTQISNVCSSMNLVYFILCCSAKSLLLFMTVLCLCKSKFINTYSQALFCCVLWKLTVLFFHPSRGLPLRRERMCRTCFMQVDGLFRVYFCFCWCFSFWSLNKSQQLCYTSQLIILKWGAVSKTTAHHSELQYDCNSSC